MKMEQQITQIDVKKISPNSLQPRKEFNKEKIKELAESIKQRGLINPIQVKKISDSDDKNDKYEIVCGERRYKAYKLLKLKKINVIIKTYKKGDEMIESLVENLQRDNLTSVEKENYITTLWELGKFESYNKLSKAIGFGSSIIAINLNSKKVRDKLKISKSISTRTISDISSLDDEDKIKVLKKIKNKELDFQNVRNYVNILKESDKETKQSLFKNEIDIQQAKQISKIENIKIKNEVIKAHKEIKKIDKDIERQLLKKVKIKTNKNQTIKTNETISLFRQNIIVLQNNNQTTIKSFLKCIPLINLMDETQTKRINYNLELLKNNVNNMLMVLEKAKKQIKLHSL